MNPKRIIIIVLLVLGLLLAGGGLWLGTNLASAIPSPDGNPVIVMKTTLLGAGTQSYLSIYPDGTVINIEEAGLRQYAAMSGPTSRIWKTGKLEATELSSLMQFIGDNADKLEAVYQFPGIVTPTGIISGDMDTVLQIDYQGISKTVLALKYLAPYSSLYLGTYAGMPSPLAEVCEKLSNVAITTSEVTREKIKITTTGLD